MQIRTKAGYAQRGEGRSPRAAPNTRSERAGGTGRCRRPGASRRGCQGRGMGRTCRQDRRRAGPATVLATVDRMSGAIMLATGILLGLAVALFTAAAIPPILEDRRRWSLL